MAITCVDRDPGYFIATISCTLDGEPCSCARRRQLKDGPERVELLVPQPQAAEEYDTVCAQIDRQSRCRQADLDLEKKVGSHDWSFAQMRGWAGRDGRISVSAALRFSGSAESSSCLACGRRCLHPVQVRGWSGREGPACPAQHDVFCARGLT
jgi:hypothetical protein